MAGRAGVVAALAVALAAGAPAGASAATKVRMSVGSAPAVAVGKPAKFTVKIANDGRTKVRGLRLSVSPAKGVKAKLAGARGKKLNRTLPALKGHRRMNVTVTLTPGSTAAARSKTTISLRAGKRLVARRTATLALRTTTPPPTPTPTPAPTPAGPANPLIGRYFYRTYLVGAGMYYDTFYFANGTATGGLAYHGRPSGGLPDCPALTAQGSGDGCTPYTYDPATGTIGVNGQTGTLSAPHVLRLGAGVFGEAITPAAGTPLDVYVHALSGSGTCGIDCTFVARQVKFAPDGQFARSTQITGSTPVSDFVALPPDQHGTYAIQPGGRVQFTYASGQTVVETIGFMLNDADLPDPTYGILLDGTIYWGPTSGV